MALREGQDGCPSKTTRECLRITKRLSDAPSMSNTNMYPSKASLYFCASGDSLFIVCIVLWVCNKQEWVVLRFTAAVGVPCSHVTVSSHAHYRLFTCTSRSFHTRGSSPTWIGISPPCLCSDCTPDDRRTPLSQKRYRTLQRSHSLCTNGRGTRESPLRRTRCPCSRACTRALGTRPLAPGESRDSWNCRQ